MSGFSCDFDVSRRTLESPRGVHVWVWALPRQLVQVMLPDFPTRYAGPRRPEQCKSRSLMSISANCRFLPYAVRMEGWLLVKAEVRNRQFFQISIFPMFFLFTLIMLFATRPPPQLFLILAHNVFNFLFNSPFLLLFSLFLLYFYFFSFPFFENTCLTSYLYAVENAREWKTVSGICLVNPGFSYIIWVPLLAVLFTYWSSLKLIKLVPLLMSSFEHKKVMSGK